jgi:integrase
MNSEAANGFDRGPKDPSALVRVGGGLLHGGRSSLQTKGGLLQPARGVAAETSKRKSLVFEFEGAAVRYQKYRNAAGYYYMIFIKEGRGRRREARTTWTSAKKRMQEICIAIANGQARMSRFTEEDRAAYLRASELLRPTGQKIEVASAIYTECVQKLSGRATISEAVDYFLSKPVRVRAKAEVPKVVQEFLADKQAQISKRWHDTLAQQLERFAEWFNGPIDELSSYEINMFLRGLSVGARARFNYRAAIQQLSIWAKGNGYLESDWAEMWMVAQPEIDPIEIKTFTPAEVAKLMANCRSVFIPFCALQVWAGLRHEEARRMDWRDVDLERGQVYVSKHVAKKIGRDRIVPMSLNLVKWLEPCSNSSGHVCALSNTSNALWRTKQKAGLPCGREETRNVLRKTFITYRLALTKNAAQVAEEAGTSVAKIRSNYGRPLRESEGAQLFDIWPTQAEILQLNFSGF